MAARCLGFVDVLAPQRRPVVKGDADLQPQREDEAHVTCVGFRAVGDDVGEPDGAVSRVIDYGRAAGHHIAPPPAVPQAGRRVLVPQEARDVGDRGTALVVVARPRVGRARGRDSRLVRAEGLLALGGARAGERRLRVEVAVAEARDGPAAGDVGRERAETGPGKTDGRARGNEELDGAHGWEKAVGSQPTEKEVRGRHSGRHCQYQCIQGLTEETSGSSFLSLNPSTKRGLAVEWQPSICNFAEYLLASNYHLISHIREYNYPSRAPYFVDVGCGSYFRSDTPIQSQLLRRKYSTSHHS